MGQVSEKRSLLYSLLGKVPERNRKIAVNLIGEEERASFVLEKLILDVNGEEPVPAYFLRTKKASGKAPVMVYNHAHGGNYEIGKEEVLTGRPALQNPPYGEVLTELGYSVFCLDTWAFGERAIRSETDIFKQMLWRGQVMWGMMVYDSLRALDYLETRPEVDPERIGTMGISMGSTMAWWLAALDDRIRVTVDICCMTDFHELMKQNNLAAHGLYYYVPDLLNHFSTASINELIAPRPHLSVNGDLDPLTPVEGLIRIDEHLKQVYSAYGKPEAWKLLRYEAGHTETAEMRTEIIAFLKRWM